MSVRVLFFGVRAGTQAGHYLCDPTGTLSGRAMEAMLPEPLRRLDGVWCHPRPMTREEIRSHAHVRTDETQGRAYIHDVEGWTVVSWWDRSADPRGGCCAAFVAEGRRPFAHMLDLARANFPREMARMEAAYPIGRACADLAPDGDDAAADTFIATFDALHPQVRALVLQRLRTRRLETTQ